MDLFDREAKKTTAHQPLAERMRPSLLEDVVGQTHVTGKGSPLYLAVKNKKLFSFILFGPPGCGKTTIARIAAKESGYEFVQISAVLSGVADVRKVLKEAKERLLLFKKKTVFFVDEIHRFSKSQQDAFLKHVEEGLITLIGATTENPSFEIISPLLSRARVLRLNPVDNLSIKNVLLKALTEEKGLGPYGVSADDEILELIAASGDGDLRLSLNNLESIVLFCANQNKKIITKEILESFFLDSESRYDKSGEMHYDLISAFHKSLRGSDPDAAVYWMERMLASGEDPLYIARRMVRFASEDIGNADPNALSVAVSATDAYRFLGFPEGNLSLVHAAVYLATAPKSNRIYTAYKKAVNIVKKNKNLPVPLHLRNAPTKLMAEMGYSKGYKYPHDYQYGFVSQQYLPDKLKEERFYSPSDYGYESVVKKRMLFFENLKKGDNS